MSDTASPEPLERNGFDRWLWECDIDNVQAAKRLDCHPMTVGRYRKPFGDPNRRIPEPDVLAVIHEWSGGRVTVADFYPPHLSRRLPAEAGGVS